MTLTVDVGELVDRLPELVAEVEAGRDVVIERGSAPFARLKKEPDGPDQQTVDAARAAIRENRKNFAPVTIEEIIEWKNEGRR